jgi:hypothetical protein
MFGVNDKIEEEEEEEGEEEEEEEEEEGGGGGGGGGGGKKERMVALRLHLPKHIRGGWSQYTDNSEPVDDYRHKRTSIEAQNMVTVQSGFRTSDISITGPTR